MIPRNIYIDNLRLSKMFQNIEGCVVECGVWRGGMIAGMADVLGSSREYFLLDSFEGLPQAKKIDGLAANAWQKNKTSISYYDNCKAEVRFAEKAMSISKGNTSNKIIRGWFSESLLNFQPANNIAILRLDGDWYESTMDCLIFLYPKLCKGGIVIIDDYYTWEGCSIAVHEYLSNNRLPVKVYSFDSTICYIIKK